MAGGRWTNTTKFAFPITLGMAFNRSLWRATGRAIGVEARAMMNAGNTYSTFWAVRHRGTPNGPPALSLPPFIAAPLSARPVVLRLTPGRYSPCCSRW